MRAVLDPNVLVSALLTPQGLPARLLRAWLDGAFELVVSPALLDELARVLAYRKIAARISEDEASAVIELLGHAMVVADPETAPLVAPADPNDTYLVVLAQATGSLLVTGDAGLLALAGRIPVEQPAAFLARLDAPDGG